MEIALIDKVIKNGDNPTHLGRVFLEKALSQDDSSTSYFYYKRIIEKASDKTTISLIRIHYADKNQSDSLDNWETVFTSTI